MAQWQRNNDIDIGVWDPTSVSKSNPSPVPQQTRQADPYDALPTNSLNSFNEQNSGSWHSQPMTNYTPNPASAMAYNNVAPRSTNPSVDSSIYYNPDGYSGYVEQTPPPSVSPYSNASYQSNNTSNSSFNPQSQQQWSSGNNAHNQTWSSGGGSGGQGRSDIQNWRNPPAQVAEPYRAPSSYTAPQPSYNQSRPPTQYQHYSNFTNPLNVNDEEDAESADVKVDHMRRAAEEAKIREASMMRKPTNISKAALAMVQRDLQAAAAPFQSADTLKKFRNMHLGISPLDGDESNNSDGDKSSDEIAKSSNLSALAVAFVPRQSSSCLLENGFINAGGDDSEIVVIPKLNLPISPDSDRALIQTEGSHLSTEAAFCTSTPYPSESRIPADSSQNRNNVFDPYETDIFTNPMDGSNLKYSPQKKANLPFPIFEDESPIQGISLMSSSRQFHVENREADFANTDNKPIESLFAVSEGSNQPELSRKPFVEGLDLSKWKGSYFPLLGLKPLSELGFQSEEESIAELKLKLKQSNTVTTPSEGDDQNEGTALKLVDDCINQLTLTPAAFDEIVPSMTDELRSYNLGKPSVEKIVDVIYEMCVIEANFRYLGAQLCDTLSRSETGLSNFRSVLLSKAQKEFGGMDEALASEEKIAERARGFTRFVAELFLSLMLERKNCVMERFAVLGRALLGVVTKLVAHPSNENLQCAIRVLKLTVISLEDSLKDDGKDSLKTLESTLDDMISFLDEDKRKSSELSDSTINLLIGFKNLRSDKWGRVEPEDPDWAASQSKEYFPHKQNVPNDEDFYMNEPVFFTPNGVQYTAADAADPEFYKQYLAPHAHPHTLDQTGNSSAEATPGPSGQHSQHSVNPLNPEWEPDYGWPQAPDHYDDHTAEDQSTDGDDYDIEFDMFLKGMIG